MTNLRIVSSCARKEIDRSKAPTWTTWTIAYLRARTFKSPSRTTTSTCCCRLRSSQPRSLCWKNAVKILHKNLLSLTHSHTFHFLFFEIKFARNLQTYLSQNFTSHTLFHLLLCPHFARSMKAWGRALNARITSRSPSEINITHLVIIIFHPTRDLREDQALNQEALQCRKLVKTKVDFENEFVVVAFCLNAALITFDLIPN